MMQNTAGIEAATSNALETAQKQVNGQDKRGAMETLNTALETRNPTWVKNHEKIALLFLELAVEAEKEKLVRSAIAQYQRICVASNELGSFEEVIGTLMIKTAAKVKSVMEANTSVDQSNSQMNMWKLYSGEPFVQNNTRRCDNIMSFFSAVFRHVAGRTAHDGKFTVLYQNTIQQAFQVCRSHERFNELYTFSEASRRQLEDALKRDEQRTSIMNKAEAIDAIVRTKLMQIEVATDMKHWRVAANALDETKQFFDAVQQQRKSIKVIQWMPFYEQVGRLFLAVDQLTLHSFAAIKRARLASIHLEKEDPEIARLASAAVLSVLCLPNLDGAALSFTSDEAVREHRKSAALERFIGVTVAPTRASLSADLTVVRAGSSLLDLAYPEAKKMYDLLHSVTTFDVCQKLKPLLDSVIGQAASLSVYSSRLEAISVQSMLAVMARCYSKVTIPHLLQLVPFYSMEQYSSHLEPLLLNPATPNCTFTIDMANKCVVMGTSTQKDVVGALSKFSADLAGAVQVCYRETGSVTKEEDKNVIPKTPKSLFELMEAEKERLAAKHEIAKKRIGCEEERAEALKKKEADRKQAEIDRIRKIENERFEKLRQEADKRQQQQIDELRMIEQHKWVNTVLKQRHPGLKLDEKATKLSDDKYKEDTTATLTKHVKSKSSKKTDGLRAREHLERAIREEEIPLVKEQAEARKEDPAEREARLAKRAEQLKRDHEAAVKIKQRLAMFEADRRQYEEKILGAVARSDAAKASKMDKQDEALRLEKERREREAAEVEAAEAAQKERESAAPKPSTSTFGGGKGAWKPKSRQ